jgi:hypothetical protein
MNRSRNVAATDRTYASEAVEAIFQAWKAMEDKRSQIVLAQMDIDEAQWIALQHNIYAARDAYYLAMSQFIDSSDPAVAAAKARVDEVRRELAEIRAEREQLIGVLSLVEKLVGLVGKLLALASG